MIPGASSFGGNIWKYLIGVYNQLVQSSLPKIDQKASQNFDELFSKLNC